ncbi:hypothetical protein [Paraburkholderia sp. GAS348]|jgi:hypothetical protein
MRVLQGSGDLLRDALSMGDKRPSKFVKGYEIIGLLVSALGPVACWVVS